MKTLALLAAALVILALPLPAAPLAAGPVEAVYNAQVQTTEILRTTKNAAGEDIVYPATRRPEVTGLKVRIPPGCETGWHTHSVPGYAFLISGALTLLYDPGTPRSFKAGEAFVESAGVLHNGRNLGTEDVVLVVFFTGELGAAFTIKPAPAGALQK